MSVNIYSPSLYLLQCVLSCCLPDQIIIVFPMVIHTHSHIACLCAFNYSWDIEVGFVFDLSRLLFDMAWTRVTHTHAHTMYICAYLLGCLTKLVFGPTGNRYTSQICAAHSLSLSLSAYYNNNYNVIVLKSCLAI